MRTFGEFIKIMREKNRITLREFCRLAQIDPSNWSKIERGTLQPPKSKIILQEIAKILKLEEGSDEYYLLFDLAAISFIPKNLVDGEDIVQKLPVFFRTLRGQSPTRKELEELIKILKEE
ncbi:MAG: helix-turn-helix domain-containing protein [Calditrichia bacterium]|nr:helix-turn-helix domain-containing protein [Calditrichia bacterium]MCK5455022.1 helix-turn-helix domain-containing protein [Calditrichia bacterium]